MSGRDPAGSSAAAAGDAVRSFLLLRPGFALAAWFVSAAATLAALLGLPTIAGHPGGPSARDWAALFGAAFLLAAVFHARLTVAAWEAATWDLAAAAPAARGAALRLIAVWLPAAGVALAPVLAVRTWVSPRLAVAIAPVATALVQYLLAFVPAEALVERRPLGAAVRRSLALAGGGGLRRHAARMAAAVGVPAALGVGFLLQAVPSTPGGGLAVRDIDLWFVLAAAALSAALALWLLLPPVLAVAIHFAAHPPRPRPPRPAARPRPAAPAGGPPAGPVPAAPGAGDRPQGRTLPGA